MDTILMNATIGDLALLPPETEDELRAWLEPVLEIEVPEARCSNHCSPFAYLAHSYFQHSGGGDPLVWANRGGGKKSFFRRFIAAVRRRGLGLLKWPAFTDARKTLCRGR